MEKINIKKKVKHVWKALEFMRDGLLKQSRRKKFKIFMGTFGQSVNDICYGCAATCTIQEIANKNFVNGEIVNTSSRAEYLHFDKYELSHFEDAIDSARAGFLSNIFSFLEKEDMYHSHKDKLRYTMDDFCMDGDDWKDEIPSLNKVIAYCKKNKL